MPWTMPAMYVPPVWVTSPAMRAETIRTVVDTLDAAITADGGIRTGPVQYTVDPVWVANGIGDDGTPTRNVYREAMTRMLLLPDQAGPLPAPPLYLVEFTTDWMPLGARRG